MNEAQRIVDEVRFRLHAADFEPTPELQRLATEYAALCHEVNNRLRRCGEFLKQGLRAEAVHLAEAEPNLLDTFAVADFPERSEWDELLGTQRLPRPEPLLLDVAEQLNEAYTLHLPVEKLLDRHRLLALIRGPLVQRLAVMRKLAEADPESPFWDADIREFEKLRAAEIEGQAEAAAARGDGDALAVLAAELMSDAWRQPPPNAILQAVKRLALQSLAGDLAAAHAAGSLDRGRLLRDRWKDLAARMHLAANDRLAAGVRPAMKWLAAEDAKGEASQEYHARLAALEQALAAPQASIADLEQARRDVLDCGRDVPEPLAGRLYGRLVQLRRGAGNRRRKVIGLAVVAAGVVISIIGLLVHTTLRADAARQLVEEADQMIGRGQLSEARHTLDQVSGLRGGERYEAVQKKLVDAEGREQARVASFQAAVEKARSADARPEAEAALQEADRLAVTNPERLLVADLTTKWNLKGRDDSENAEDRFQEQLNETTDALDRLEDLHSQGATDPAFLKLLETAERQVAELKRLATRVKPSLARHVPSAESRLSRIHSEVANSRKRAELLEQLTGESLIEPGHVDPDAQVRQFARTLRQFSEAFPGDVKARDFGDMARELDSWRGILSWQQLRDKWQPLAPANVAAAKSRASQCDAWVTEFGTSAAGPLLREYLAYLRHIVARDEDDSGDEKEGIRAKLLRLFSGPFIDGAQVIEYRDGRTYYVKTRFVAEGDGKTRFRYLVNSRGETETKSVLPDELKSPRSREAPQSALGAKIRQIVSTASMKSWNGALLHVAELLRDAENVDPLLRYLLIRQTLEYAQEGDSLLKVELEPVVAALADKSIDEAAHWMNPDDADANRMKRPAGEKLGRLGDLKAAWKRASARELALHDRLSETVFPVGWLSQEGQKGWQCRSAWKPPAESALWIAVPATGEKAAKWVEIGDAVPGRGLALANDAGEQLKEGRLVFVRKK